MIYEDNYLIAVNKPPRAASVPAENIPLQQTVLGLVQRQFKEKQITPYLLHRLDFQTSGVLLFGKHERDRQALENIFRQPDTRKKYIALVKGVPRGSVITKKLPGRSTSEKIPAQTNYKILKVLNKPGAPLCALVETEIKTGRRHQIRQHFAAIGHPVILDSKYGDFHFNRKFRLTFRLGRLFLHASTASFYHPMLKKITTVEAPLPPDLQIALKRLNSI